MADNFQSPLRDLARQLMDVARQHLAYSQVTNLMDVVNSHLSALARIEEINHEHKGKK